MWKVDNDEENNDRQRIFFSDRPFKFGSGELIIKATDAIIAVTGPNMQKISDSNVRVKTLTHTPPPLEV